MTHFAEIDSNGIVLRVIVAEQDFIDSGAVGNPANWIQTSYNTLQGKHTRGGTPLRKNYAGKGYQYDKARDMFIPPKKFEEYVLNEEKGVYEPPIPIPDTKKPYKWDHKNKKWRLNS